LPQRVRDLIGKEANELLRHRFEFVNPWRPIRGPLRDAPLAVCDATTVAFVDFVPSDLFYRDLTREIYRVRYNRAHRWFYVPMQVDEVILIKCYAILRIPLPRSREGNEECQIIFHCHCLIALAG
jgi:hypothetical protein